MYKIDQVAAQFSVNIKKKLGSHLKSLILFGSRARGDAGPSSDYDFLILVDERSSAIVRLIRQTEVELIDSSGALSGSLICSEEEWKKRKNLPIGINVDREGIVL
jgi:predicted nucleotidyltransferase